MDRNFVFCNYCHKSFFKDIRRIHENLKLGYKNYCSLVCLSKVRSKQIVYKCENPKCQKVIYRAPNDVSPHNYCSQSCAATINNSKFPKRPPIIKSCPYCNKSFTGDKIFCSFKCSVIAHTTQKETVIKEIKEFYVTNGRIPLKREKWNIYKAARRYFGTWNNAIIAAGFKPNPVMFANHQIAKDGHICDSLAEQIIDDYLYENKISHERSVSYPEGSYTADFRIGDKLIEFFGLAGEHKRYDELRTIKKKLVKKYGLSLIEIYPQDLRSADTMTNMLYPHIKTKC